MPGLGQHPDVFSKEMGGKTELNLPQNKDLDYDFVQDWAAPGRGLRQQTALVTSWGEELLTAGCAALLW